MDEFMDRTHAIRFSLIRNNWDVNVAHIDMMHPLTREQERTIIDVIAITDGNIELDLENGLGEWDAYTEMYIKKPSDKKSISFEDDSRQRILSSINRFYAERRS